MSAAVGLYTNAWVSGTCSRAYYGLVRAEVFLPDYDVKEDRAEAWLLAEESVLDLARVRAARLGANAVVGAQMDADPWHVRADGVVGLLLLVTGTAALLESLYPDIPISPGF